VYVCEESHRGIVPMNHSNKDGASSAESEEGRLRLKENTLSSDTYPTQSGTARVPWVGEGCGQAIALAAIHLREEPDALMSARPGPSGGYPVRGIPTGSNSQTDTLRIGNVRRGEADCTLVPSLSLSRLCYEVPDHEIYANGDRIPAPP
jgi:hypothetical protein